MASVREFDVDPALSITTLGAAFVVAGRERSTTGRSLGPGKPLALLTFLACSPGRSSTRDALVDLLWADVEREDGRHALRQTIWYIKKNLGERATVATRDTVRIAAPVESDRDAFLAAIDEQRFEDAISIYRGDFFPDFAQPGAVEFEHWVELERQRLRSAFLRAGQAVVRGWVSIARIKDAVKLARRLRDTEASEANWRLVLESLVAASDHLGAALEADALEQFIAKEEREPEPATRSMLRIVRQAPKPTSAPEAGSLIAALIGRETEFAALVSAWDNARQKESRHVHIVAPAGIGKTRLLIDFAARLRSQRSHVALAAARPGERSLSYALASEVAGALAQLAGAAGIGEAAAASLVALNPSLSANFAAPPDPATADEALRRRTIALRDLITSVADERPLAILIDDWHWADALSQQLLGSAVQRLTGERVLVVSTSRPGYASPEGPHTQRVALDALSPAEVGEVIASLAQLPDEAWCDQLARAVHSASDGSPLLVMETIQWLIDRGVAAIENDEWRLRDLQSLRSIDKSGSAVRQRLDSLDSTERSIIEAMAVAGVPLSPEILSAAVHLDHRELVRRVGPLEHRGFIVRSADALNVAHDVIAEAALDALGVTERREAEWRVGSALLAAAGHDRANLLQAGRHLLRADNVDQAAVAFARWVRAARRDGDARPLRKLAIEFAGPDVPGARAEQLTAGVPFADRFSRAQKRGAVFAIAIVLTVALILRLRPTSEAAPPPVVQLVAAFTGAKADTVVASISLRADELTRLDVIDVGSLPRSTRHAPIGLNGRGVLSPDGRTWAGERTFSDSGGIELVTIDVASGTMHRLTHRHGDDGTPSWSPTGDALAFSTGGFDSLAHTDIAIINLATGRIRQLTHGDESDDAPAWNPRGDAIAFSRRYWTPNRDGDLCLASVDGSSVRCRPVEHARQVMTLGWYDPDHLIIATGSRLGFDRLAVVDINTSDVLTIFRGDVRDAQASPDGRYVSCRCADNPQVPGRWWIVSVNDPGTSVEVVKGRVSNDPLTLAWVGPPRRPLHFTSLHIDGASDTVPVGASFQLQATGVDAGGRRTAISRVRWQSSDPRIATVDSTGLITPRLIGTFHIDASAGSWVSASRPFVVTHVPSQTLASFDWSALDVSRTIPFGDPKPMAINDQRMGRALLINGDDSFTSGIVTSAAFDGRRGLAIEMVVSTPITAMQWQSITVALDPGIDSVRFAAWDRRTGSIPLVTTSSACAMSFPAAEGPDGLHQIGIGFGSVPAPQNIGSGRPFKLLVQLFPDGRCGVAIDGTPIAIAPTRPPMDGRYRVSLYGYSYHTRILVGRVVVSSGVRPGVDWSTVPTARQH